MFYDNDLNGIDEDMLDFWVNDDIDNCSKVVEDDDDNINNKIRKPNINNYIKTPSRLPIKYKVNNKSCYNKSFNINKKRNKKIYDKKLKII